MPSLARNHRQVLAAPPIGGKRTRYTVDGVPGLLLDVFASGRRVWYVRYLVGDRPNRKWRSLKLGDATALPLSDAVERARKIKVAVDDGADPIKDKRSRTRGGKTFGDLFDSWYERHALAQLARPIDERKKYDNHLREPFGTTAVLEIQRTDVAALRDRLVVDSGPVSSNNIVTLFNRVMNWAVDEGLVAFNPAHRLRKVGLERPRERVLSHDEVKTLWLALSRLDAATNEHVKQGKPGRILSVATRCAIRILLLTGQRRGEVAGIRKAEIDLHPTEPVWTIPSHRTKNRLLHRIPLCPMARHEFEQALQASRRNSEFLFPTAVLDGRDAPIIPDALSRAMNRLTSELGITGVGPHDLRRTVGTELARLGLPTHVRSLILNHSPESRGVTDVVYNRYAYDREKRDALMQWEVRLAEIVGLNSAT